MKYSFLLSFFLLFGIFFHCLAQTDTNRTSVTVVYSKVEYKRTEKDKSIYNLIKINPLLVLNGDIPLYYERRIKDRFSIEGGIGFTHMDYIYHSYVLYDEYGEEERRAKPGYSLMVSAKFYPSSYTKALDEFYFGPEIRFRRYNTEVEDCETTSFSGYLPEYRMVTDFKITVGYITYLTDEVILDFYGGIGMRSRNVSLAYCDHTSLNPIMIYDNYTDMVPLFSAGIKLGFGF
jgi:hypothetical protein